jgi:secreted protein with Ig-like and vWFA domain
MTILASKTHPELEKKVIYAFSREEDATKFQDTKDAKIVAQSFPVGQILFQMFTMKEVDSIVFIDDIEDAKKSTKINCSELQTAIQQQLKKIIPKQPPKNFA